MANNNYIFTQRVEDLYPVLNQTLMTFAYREYDKRTFAEITKGLKIKTDADYRANMHHFAAKPNFKVSLQHSTPNFLTFKSRRQKINLGKRSRGIPLI